MNAVLEQGAGRLGLELSPPQLSALETYIAAVLDCNKTYNLMKAATADEVAAHHVLDSLAAAPHIAALITERAQAAGAAATIADIGSGGGCPGLPLAAAFPAAQFVLVERMERRCDFLRDAIRRMGLANVRVHCVQADKVQPGSFDVAVFRAFHPFEPKTARLLLALLKDGGYLAAYKARSEKITAEMAAVAAQIPEYKKIALTVPFLEDHERHLVVVQKKAHI